MTMSFRTLKDSIVTNVLGPASAGKFVVVGYQRQSKNATEVLGTNRTVQVFYAEGVFPRPAGRLNGPVHHDVTYRLELTVAAAASGDLAVINDPMSTPEQIAAAIAAFQEAAAIADASFDELADEVYQVVMSGLNYDLGLTRGSVANRWISGIEKDQPVPKGAYVALTGSMTLNARVTEQVPGDAGTALESIDTIIDLEGDDVERTGVEVRSQI